MFVGYIQNLEDYEVLVPPCKPGFKTVPSNYIVTDYDGVIVNVSHGLS